MKSSSDSENKKDSILQVAKGIKVSDLVTESPDNDVFHQHYLTEPYSTGTFDSATIYSIIDLAIAGKLKVYRNYGDTVAISIAKSNEGIILKNNQGIGLDTIRERQFVNGIRFFEDWNFNISKGTFVKTIDGMGVLRYMVEKNVYHGIQQMMYIKFNN